MTTDRPGLQIDPTRVLGVTRARLPLILVIAAASALAALFPSLARETRYEATVRVVLPVGESESVLIQQLIPRDVDTELEVLRTDAVARRALDDSAATATADVEVVRVEPTRMVDIVATAESPNAASRAAEGYAAAYREHSREAATELGASALHRIDEELGSLGDASSVAQDTGNASESGAGPQAALLALRSQVPGFQDLAVPRILGVVKGPQSVGEPNHVQDAALGFIFGLLVAATAAIVIDVITSTRAPAEGSREA